MTFSGPLHGVGLLVEKSLMVGGSGLTSFEVQN